MDTLASQTSMWRYANHLPLADPGAKVSLGEGWTPLLDAARYAHRLGCARIRIKDEAQNPTGTFKDRSAAYTLSLLREQGCAGVVLNSTGNASASFAVYAARAGMQCVTIVPADVLEENLMQMRMAGAHVHILQDWSTAREMTRTLATRTGFTNVSADCTPAREQAKQTVGLEIVEQLGGAFPGAFFCPTGGGIALLAVRRAFRWLSESGAATGPQPRLFASQFSGCAPIARAFNQGKAVVEAWGAIDTPRGGMRTPNPGRGNEVLGAIATGGAYCVEPAEAARAAAALAAADGILVGLETGSALVAIARAIDAGTLDRETDITVLNTSTPLKSDPSWLARGK